MSVSEPSLHPKRRSQASRRDASEAQLIEATMAVVATRGVQAATFDAIGQMAGFSRGLATQRFGSKRGLIDAVIAYLHRRRETILANARVNNMPALDAITFFADRHMRELKNDFGVRAYFMLLSGSVADASPMREAFAASNKQVSNWLESLIRRGQANGTIRRELNPPASALMVGSLVQGVCIQWLVDQATDLEAIRVSTLAALRNSLCA